MDVQNVCYAAASFAIQKIATHAGLTAFFGLNSLRMAIQTHTQGRPVPVPVNIVPTPCAASSVGAT